MQNKAIKFEAKKKFLGKSERVKCVDIHPTEPWVLSALYNGTVLVWNYETQVVIKTFEITSLPVRSAKFVARKNWIVTGSDDLQIRAFNYNTHERVAAFDAHGDYIRCVAIHPSKPFVLSSADDLTIKLWDWEKNWACVKVFEGHMHYVMCVTFNPKDANTFASCSLDRTIKVWNLASNVPNYTLDGHDKGVCSISYYPGPDKPYLASGGDDKLVKLWDYQNKSCIQTLEGHSHNVSCVSFHPSLPLLFSGSEDESLRVWNMNSFRLENYYQFGYERMWAITHIKGSNWMALGCDKGTIVLQLGRDEPSISLDSSGKMIWAKNNEILTSNIKTAVDKEIANGAKLILPIKELGQCEIYPTKLKHSPSGRFVAVLGDGEYIIYTALAWRNKSFGSAVDFAWSSDSNFYAVQESNYKLTIYKNFGATTTVSEPITNLFGGTLLAVQQSGLLYFRSWEDGTYIRRMDVDARQLYWSELSNLLVIATQKDGFFVLKYHHEAVDAYIEQGIPIDADGIEESFEVIAEQPEDVMSGVWVGDCFVFTTFANKLVYYVGGQTYPVATLERALYIIGYLPASERVYLADKDCSVYSYSLSLSVIEYQMNILRGDLTAARELLPKLPETELASIAKFLESHHFQEEAMNVTTDEEHRFALALELKHTEVAMSIADKQASDTKWSQLARLSLAEWNVPLAKKCLEQSKDLSDLLLLNYALGDMASISRVADLAEINKQHNLRFFASFLSGKKSECVAILVDAGRLPEAALFARTYYPAAVPEIVALWRAKIQARENKIVDYSSLIASPLEHPELFPNSADSLFASMNGVNKSPSSQASKTPSLPPVSPPIPVQQAAQAASYEAQAEVGTKPRLSLQTSSTGPSSPPHTSSSHMAYPVEPSVPSFEDPSVPFFSSEPATLKSTTASAEPLAQSPAHALYDDMPNVDLLSMEPSASPSADFRSPVLTPTVARSPEPSFPSSSFQSEPSSTFQGHMASVTAAGAGNMTPFYDPESVEEHHNEQSYQSYSDNQSHLSMEVNTTGAGSQKDDFDEGLSNMNGYSQFGGSSGGGGGGSSGGGGASTALSGKLHSLRIQEQEHEHEQEQEHEHEHEHDQAHERDAEHQSDSRRLFESSGSGRYAEDFMQLQDDKDD